MITHRLRSVLPSMIVFAALLSLIAADSAVAAPTPNKLLLTGHFGKEVNKTGTNVCTAKEECQPGKESSEAGGFLNPYGVAVNNDASSPTFGDVYVSDSQNHRVQVLTSSGQFVSMFGWDVNQTKVETAGTKQSERNVCTAESKDVCKAGVGGPAPGQFAAVTGPVSIAVDPVSGDVYVVDVSYSEVAGEFAESRRVQEFTAEGQLVLEIGKEVNEAPKGNVCIVGEVGAKCTGAALQTPTQAGEDSEPGAFANPELSSSGGLLAVGGPEDLLYVGDQGRIQKFKSSGVSAGEISLAGPARSIAVNPVGDVFESEGALPGIHEYSPSGQLQPGTIDPASVYGPPGIAVDPHGNLAVLEQTEAGQKGGLYSTSGAKLSTFEIPSYSGALAIASTGNAYLLTVNEVDAYNEIAFPQTVTCPVGEVTATTAKLCGEVNPDGVPAKGFFQYGPTQPLASLTPVLFTGEGETFISLTDELTGLTPNQAYGYRTAAEATFSGEALVGTGEEVTFHTPVIPPQIVGAASASFMKEHSAVLSASLNPEHTPTRYHFEYGPCPSLAGCANVQSTPDQRSAAFGTTGSAQEVSGLVPLSTYSYRLVADNEFEEEGKTFGGKATGLEGTFTTTVSPAVEASTGQASAITSTSAVISGAVNPKGLAGTYAFELGVYAGAATAYGVTTSGTVPAEDGPVGESQQLTGLQPGTTYAYRIVLHGADGEAVATPGTFTTQGLPSVLSSPAPTTLLATPNIAFPGSVSVVSGVSPKKLTRAQLLARALKACHKQQSKRKRASCIRQARRRYGPVVKVRLVSASRSWGVCSPLVKL